MDLPRRVVSLCMAVAAFCAATNLGAADIGVAWEGKSGMADKVMAGFDEAIKGQGITVEYQKNLANIEELKKVIARFEKEKAAMVILRSTGAEVFLTHRPAIPTFLGACNNPPRQARRGKEHAGTRG
ncbi:MAG TPA: hypothetical protein PLW83_03130 [Deltaproteobacteria bacterium]|nr:hypothetical protein [Deltaproteobacteria bacterium]